MVINIPTNTELIFRQYLTIINGVLSSEKRLTKIEIDILDKLLYIDYLYRHLSRTQRDSILFNKETKIRIRKSILDTSEASYNNVISNLRKKGIIKGKSLVTKIPIINNKIQLEFNLQLPENGTIS